MKIESPYESNFLLLREPLGAVENSGFHSPLNSQGESGVLDGDVLNYQQPKKKNFFFFFFFCVQQHWGVFTVDKPYQMGNVYSEYVVCVQTILQACTSNALHEA